MPLRIVFMGTPAFSVPVLGAVLRAGHSVAAVYSQPPRPAGRGMTGMKSPVHVAAEAHGIVVRTPLNFKDAADREAFAGLKADAAVVVAYGLILPETILSAPRLGCFNVHGKPCEQFCVADRDGRPRIQDPENCREFRRNDKWHCRTENCCTVDRAGLAQVAVVVRPDRLHRRAWLMSAEPDEQWLVEFWNAVNSRRRQVCRGNLVE